MARINLEDNLCKDPRFMTLTALLGCEWKALGAVAASYRLAQTFWIQGKLIPTVIYNMARLPKQLIDSGWVECRTDGIYVFRSEDQFGWLVQRIKSGRAGGIASGLSRAKENGDLTEAGRKRDGSGAEAETKPLYSLLLRKEEEALSDFTNRVPADEKSSPWEILGELAQHEKLVVIFRAHGVRPKLQRAWLDRFPDPDFLTRMALDYEAKRLMDPKGLGSKKWANGYHGFLRTGWEKRQVGSGDTNTHKSGGQPQRPQKFLTTDEIERLARGEG